MENFYIKLEWKEPTYKESKDPNMGNKNEYHVEFYWNTDLRYKKWFLEANFEMINEIHNWIDNK